MSSRWLTSTLRSVVSKSRRTLSEMAPTPDKRNICWIDCEMTGLHAYLPPRDLSAGKTFVPDVILEIACIVTNAELEPLDEGIEFIAKTDKQILDSMGEWCIAQHGKTGLTSACLTSSHTLSDIDTALCRYLQQHFPPDSPALLAGNSVHADAAFIKKDLPKTAEMLHYRILDVSSIKECVARWFPQVEENRPRGESEHRALSDIKDSIRQLKYYKDNVFQGQVPSDTEKQ